jgi:arylsulfatase I/J
MVRSIVQSLTLATVAAAAPPNIFFILVDDLGFGDVGFNRKEINSEIVSPNMDALVESGVHLTRHYVFRMCTPTRTSVQSGRLPVHVNTGLGSPCNDNTGIPRNMTGFAEHLQRAGYSTHFAGKWDAGMATPKHTPNGRGYDTSLHYFSHKNDFWSQANMQTCCESDQTIIDFWRTDHGASDVNNTDYSEFLFRNELVGIVEKHDAAKPLLLFYAPHVAHCPLQVPKEYYDKFAFMTNDEGQCSKQTVKSVHPIDPRYPDLEYKCRQQYHAMVMVMDEVVGNVTDALKKKGMWENTLVVMSSDNGGPVDLAENAANNWPLRGGKYSVFEGGIRVAAFVSGGLIPSQLRGTVNNGIIHIADWYATFAGLAGVDPTDHLAAASGLPPIDSIDMWPFLSGTVKESPRDALALPIDEKCIVKGDWKLITAKTTPDFWQGPTFPNSTSLALAETPPARPYPYPTECKSEAAQDWSKDENFEGAICSSSMKSCFNVQQSKTNIILYASSNSPNERFKIAANGSLVGDLRGQCVRVNGLGQQHTFGACDQDEWQWSFQGKELSVSHKNGTKWCIAAHEAPQPPPSADHCAGGCLFNVVEDPTEQSNVYADHPDLVASMSAQLTDMKKSYWNNKDKFSNDCPDGEENCACWMAKNRYEGFMGPYALTSSQSTLV